MPDTRTYYVLSDDNCKFESMTKEQIYDAIEDATGNIPSGHDDAFITKIKEMNKQGNLQFWVGTTAEYNALTEKIRNCFYILMDDTEDDDIRTIVAELQEAVEALGVVVEGHTEAIAGKQKAITSGTSAPSGGSNGDIYIWY